MSTALASAAARLAAVDRRLDAELAELGRVAASLAPGRRRATALEALGRALVSEDDSPALVDAFAGGLSRLVLSQLDAFPDNLFWDLDYPAACALTRARRSRDAPAQAERVFADMIELQHLYGRHTAIAFRYVHDFNYGFDWAKWVAREPTQDGSVGPFDLEFLGYMKARAHELLALIARDDAKYPGLREGEARNPFPFSREPEAERRLFPELARRGLIPVEAWRIDARPDCQRPFQALRNEVARELCL